MSNTYPVWWDTTITLYNKYEDSTGEITWYRTVLEGCFWKYTTKYERVDDVVQMTKVLTCRVRRSDDFLESYEWYSSLDKASHFTFSEGDILVKGEVSDTINEYTSGSMSTDLLKKYKDRCAQITESTIDTGIGRVCEHYLVRGI